MKLVLTVKIDGKWESVTLSGGSHFPKSYGMIRTSNKKLQTALEKHSSFNKSFFLENTEWVKDGSEPELTDLKDGKNKPLEFNNFNELRDYLIKEQGRAPITVSTMAKAAREMEKLDLKYVMK